MLCVVTATSQEFLIEIRERICKPYCVGSTHQPVATVTFADKEVCDRGLSPVM